MKMVKVHRENGENTGSLVFKIVKSSPVKNPGPPILNANTNKNKKEMDKEVMPCSRFSKDATTIISTSKITPPGDCDFLKNKEEAKGLEAEVEKIKCLNSSSEEINTSKLPKFRQSSRLLTLLSKKKISQTCMYEESICEKLGSTGSKKRKRKCRSKSYSAVKKETKIKNKTRAHKSLDSFPNVSRIMNGSQNSHFKKHLSPKKLELKSILLIPSAQGSSSALLRKSLPMKTTIVPAFANMDPSRILSAVGREIALKHLPSNKPVSLFLSGRNGILETLSTVEKDKINLVKENSIYNYYFKKIKADLSAWGKKYHMLNIPTFENCCSKLHSLKKIFK